MSVDMLGTSWNQCRSMVQYSFTSTETRRLVRTDSPGRPPRLSHSSWTVKVLSLFAKWSCFDIYLKWRTHVRYLPLHASLDIHTINRTSDQSPSRICHLRGLSQLLGREPVWLSGKALGWYAEGSRFESALALFFHQKLLSVDIVLWLCPSQLIKH